MDTINFDTFDSPAGGVELSDTLSSWRKKTNGIITKVSSLDSASTTLETKVNNSGFNVNSLALNKIVKVGGSKLLGNLASGSDNVVEIEIDATASGLQDSDSTIPTSKAVKDHVALGERYISGIINANGTAAALHGISVSRSSIGVYNIIVADSHQLPSTESYSVGVSINLDFDENPTGTSSSGAKTSSNAQIVNNQYQATVRKINDIGGDPAYQVKIFELEVFSFDGGSDDGSGNANARMPFTDVPFSILGLPATIPS